MEAAGEDFNGWARARDTFLKANGATEPERGEHWAVEWNERAFSVGVSPLPHFDRAIAFLLGRPLPDAQFVDVLDRCARCGGRTWDGDKYCDLNCEIAALKDGLI